MMGVMLLEASEAGLLPAAFTAVTVKVYAVPLVSPASVALLAGAATVRAAPAGLELTV